MDSLHFLTQPCSATCHCAQDWHINEPDSIIRVASKFRNPSRLPECRGLIQGILGAHARKDFLLNPKFYIEGHALCKPAFLRLVNITEEALQQVIADWLDVDISAVKDHAA